MSWTAARVVPLLAAAATSISSLSVAAAASNSSTSPHSGDLPSDFLTQLSQWREHHLSHPPTNGLGGNGVGPNAVLAWILAFVAASVSSAGGVGGGSLFLPILNLVAGLSLKRAATYSSFMVTGGAASNVLYNLLWNRGRVLIDYDIALLFQPCLLLGVSIGVVCNVMFPEWLITALFSLFLAFCTVKTCRAGVKIWRSESCAASAAVAVAAARHNENKEPLLVLLPAGQDGGQAAAGNGAGFPWKDVSVLVAVWLCFFLLHAFIGDKHGKGMIRITPCGIAYWLFTISQVPFSVAFTAYIIYAKRKKQLLCNQEDGKANCVETKTETMSSLILPLAAFVTGSLSGLFGIGGGLLLNPVLLQMGIPPQTAAATSSFMVLFCASMSMVQFILLGMDGIGEASVYAGICFVASVAGAVLIEKAVRKSGRVSMIVFLVTAIMALSTVIVTCFGALDVWKQYNGGAYMGFKLPC